MEKNLTRFLEDWRQGNHNVADKLYETVYDDIRIMARGLMRGERANHTLGATALSNEAWLKMVRSPFQWNNTDDFFRLIRHAMKQILEDYARWRNAQKRPNNRMVDLAADGRPFDPMDSSGHNIEQILQLEEALEQLSEVDPRGARILWFRDYVGLSEQETAELLNQAPTLIRKELRIGRKWMGMKVEHGNSRQLE